METISEFFPSLFTKTTEYGENGTLAYTTNFNPTKNYNLDNLKADDPIVTWRNSNYNTPTDFNTFNDSEIQNEMLAFDEQQCQEENLRNSMIPDNSNYFSFDNIEDEDPIIKEIEDLIEIGFDSMMPRSIGHHQNAELGDTENSEMGKKILSTKHWAPEVGELETTPMFLENTNTQDSIDDFNFVDNFSLTNIEDDDPIITEIEDIIAAGLDKMTPRPIGDVQNAQEFLKDIESNQMETTMDPDDEIEVLYETVANRNSTEIASSNVHFSNNFHGNDPKTPAFECSNKKCSALLSMRISVPPSWIPSLCRKCQPSKPKAIAKPRKNQVKKEIPCGNRHCPILIRDSLNTFNLHPETNERLCVLCFRFYNTHGFDRFTEEVGEVNQNQSFHIPPENWQIYDPNLGCEVPPRMVMPCLEEYYINQENSMILPNGTDVFQTGPNFGCENPSTTALPYPEYAYPNQDNLIVIANNEDICGILPQTVPEVVYNTDSVENFNDDAFVENGNYRNDYHDNNWTEYPQVRNEADIPQAQSQDFAYGYQSSFPVQNGGPSNQIQKNKKSKKKRSRDSFHRPKEPFDKKTKCTKCHKTFSRRKNFSAPICRECKYTSRAILLAPEARRCSNETCKKEFKVWPHSHPITKKKICQVCYLHFKKNGIFKPYKRRWNNSKKGKFICANDFCGAKTNNLRPHPVTQKKICSKCFEKLEKNGTECYKAKAYKKQKQAILSECDNENCGVIFDYLSRHHPVTGKAICRPCYKHFREFGTERLSSEFSLLMFSEENRTTNYNFHHEVPQKNQNEPLMLANEEYVCPEIDHWNSVVSGNSNTTNYNFGNFEAENRLVPGNMDTTNYNIPSESNLYVQDCQEVSEENWIQNEQSDKVMDYSSNSEILGNANNVDNFSFGNFEDVDPIIKEIENIIEIGLVPRPIGQNSNSQGISKELVVPTEGYAPVIGRLEDNSMFSENMSVENSFSGVIENDPMGITMESNGQVYGEESTSSSSVIQANIDNSPLVTIENEEPIIPKIEDNVPNGSALMELIPTDHSENAHGAPGDAENTQIGKMMSLVDKIETLSFPPLNVQEKQNKKSQSSETERQTDATLCSNECCRAKVIVKRCHPATAKVICVGCHHFFRKNGYDRPAETIASSEQENVNNINRRPTTRITFLKKLQPTTTEEPARTRSLQFDSEAFR